MKRVLIDSHLSSCHLWPVVGHLEQPLQSVSNRNAVYVNASLTSSSCKRTNHTVSHWYVLMHVRCWSTGLAVRLWSSRRLVRSESWGSERWDEQHSSVFSWRSVSATLTLCISQRVLRDERSDTLESTLIRLEEEQQRCRSSGDNQYYVFRAWIPVTVSCVCSLEQMFRALGGQHSSAESAQPIIRG